MAVGDTRKYAALELFAEATNADAGFWIENASKIAEILNTLDGNRYP